MCRFKTVKVVFEDSEYNYTWLASCQFEDSDIKKEIGNTHYVGEGGKLKVKIINIIIDYTNKIC